ncbi:MAG: hypothetical protein ACLT98_03015 [Eggerthellaceae bacterium]
MCRAFRLHDTRIACTCSAFMV